MKMLTDAIADKASDHFGNAFPSVFAASEKENIPAAFNLKAAGISHFCGFRFFFPVFLFFFAFCRRENRGKSKRFKTENSEKPKVTHSPSPASRELPLGGSL